MEKDKNYVKMMALVKEVKEDMIKAGVPFDNFVPFVINGKLRRALGKCYFSKMFGAVRIEISKIVITHSDDAEIKNVICHELIHSAKQCLGCGHRGMWKLFADKMNWNDSRYSITATNKSLHFHEQIEAINEKSKRYKFRLQCTHCNASQSYTRETKAIKLVKDGFENLLTCSQCHHHKFEVIEIKNN